LGHTTKVGLALVTRALLGDKGRVTQKSNSKLVMAGVLVLLATAAFFTYEMMESVSPVDTVQKPSTEVVANRLKEPPAEEANRIPTSTQSSNKTAVAPEVAEDSTPKERAEEFKTPDPNDEPDNTLAGISYRDVQMWELEQLQLPKKLKGGVLISKIHAKSSFAEAQVKPGDIVTHAHHTKVATYTDLENTVTGRTHTLIDVYRDGKAFQVVLNQPFRK
jgi:S1-C subfamily serine protease